MAGERFSMTTEKEFLNEQQVKNAAPSPKDPESAFGTPSESVREPVSTPAEMDPIGSDKIGLSSPEIECFREKGYLIKRGLIPPELFSPIMDLWWKQAPITLANLDPNEPESWVSPGKYWPEENR